MPVTKGNKPLRDLREMLQISQRAAAAQADVSHIQWAQVESGTTPKSFSAEGWLSIWDTFRDTWVKLGYGCDDLLRGHRRSGRKTAA